MTVHTGTGYRRSEDKDAVLLAYRAALDRGDVVAARRIALANPGLSREFIRMEGGESNA